MGPRRKKIALQVVRDELECFVSVNEASLILLRIEECVTAVDAEVDQLRHDPLLVLSWDYDGRVFVAKQGIGLQVVFDGINILEWLKTNLHTFFRARSVDKALDQLRNELDTFLWLAEARRIHWQEEHHLGILPQCVIDAAIEEACERRSFAGGDQAQEMTAEEDIFFRRYEKQLAA